MIPRRAFAVLTTVLIVLIVALAAIMSVHALLAALGDSTGARVARGVGTALLIALSIDMVLLVAALGLRAMQSSGD